MRLKSKPTTTTTRRHDDHHPNSNVGVGAIYCSDEDISKSFFKKCLRITPIFLFLFVFLGGPQSYKYLPSHLQTLKRKYYENNSVKRRMSSSYFFRNDGYSNLLRQTNSSSSGSTGGDTSRRSSKDSDEQERKFADYYYPFTFGACLMARDDNLYLPEWIAYHYTVLPLRHLILSVDPLSWTSPLGIIDSYRQALPDLHITVWTGNHFFYDNGGRRYREIYDNFDPFNHTPSHGYHFHLQRQKAFYTKCLQELKKTSQAKIVILIDTDEYITYNTPLPGGDTGEGAPSKTQQPQSLLLVKDTVPQQIGKQNETLAHWITLATKKRQESYNSRNNTNTNVTTTTAAAAVDIAIMKNNSLCMVYPKLEFSAIEEDGEAQQLEGKQQQQRLHHHTSNTSLLYTIRYQHMLQHHKPGKPFVQLDNYDGKRFVTGCHSPFGRSCDNNGNINPSVDGDYPFRINEYPGSLETFLMRPSRTKENWLKRTASITIRGRDPINSLSKWFDHFVHDTLLGGNIALANQLTIGAKQDALKEWKNIQERIQQGEKIQPAFAWDRPSSSSSSAVSAIMEA